MSVFISNEVITLALKKCIKFFNIIFIYLFLFSFNITAQHKEKQILKKNKQILIDSNKIQAKSKQNLSKSKRVLSKGKQNQTKEDYKQFFDKTFFQSFVTTLIGSLVGAGLAIPVGLWLDRKVKNRESKKLILSLKKLLYLEIVENNNTLKNYITATSIDKNKIPDIIVSAWQVALSQNFLTDSDNIKLNTFLSKIYYQFGNTKMLADNYLNLLIVGQASNFGYKEKLKFVQEAIIEDANNSIKLIEENIHLFD